MNHYTLVDQQVKASLRQLYPLVETPLLGVTRISHTFAPMCYQLPDRPVVCAPVNDFPLGLPPSVDPRSTWHRRKRHNRTRNNR